MKANKRVRSRDSFFIVVSIKIIKITILRTNSKEMKRQKAMY